MLVTFMQGICKMFKFWDMQRKQGPIQNADATLATYRKAHEAVWEQLEQLRADYKELYEKSVIGGGNVAMPSRPSATVLTAIIGLTDTWVRLKRAADPLAVYLIIYKSLEKEQKDESDRLRRQGLHGQSPPGGNTGPISRTDQDNGTDPRSSARGGSDGGGMG